MLILSYATKDDKYLQYAQRLIQNFADVKYENFKIIYYPPYNDKFTGCLLKPNFILEQLLYYKHELMVIDIDSIIKNFPKIPNFTDYDIGFVYTPERKNIITNGIHLWNYTNNSLNFLKRWKQLCEDKKLKNLDHHRLIQTFEEFKNQINIINIRKDISNWFTAELNYNGSKISF